MKKIKEKEVTKRQLADREQIVKEISEAAHLYKKFLVGKRFLYAFDNRYIEVLYKKENFKHLTGVDTNLTAKQFFDFALKNRLQAKQIFFSKRHPYSLCKKKLRHICEIATLAYAESFMLEEITTVSASYKFGTTALKFSLCMNKEVDDNGMKVGDCYIVESLRDEDCFGRSKYVYEVTHIFSRSNNLSKKYTDLIFEDKKASVKDLSPKILELLDDSIIGKVFER